LKSTETRPSAFADGRRNQFQQFRLVEEH